MRLFNIIFLLLISGCTVANQKGILLNVEQGTPMDETDIRQHCDLGDLSACALIRESLGSKISSKISIIQGLAPPDRAVFSALIPLGENIHWFLFDREERKLKKLFTPKPISRGKSKWAIQRIDVQGLLPVREYELLAGDATGNLRDLRRFRPFSAQNDEFRISVLGGYRLARTENRKRLLEEVNSLKPQLLILAGSTLRVVLPTASPLSSKDVSSSLFEQYATARSDFEIGYLENLVPIQALWNDDEFGQPDGNSSFVYRDKTRETLELFFPHWADEETIVDGPGISLGLALPRNQIAFLDDLSFRKPPKMAPPICTKNKRGKEKCREGKMIPSGPGSRYSLVIENWLRHKAFKKEKDLWLLAGGSRLILYRADWQGDASLQDPNLSLSPAGPWVAQIVTNPEKKLELRSVSGAFKNTK